MANYLKGNVNESLTLGSTLAADTGVVGIFSSVVEGRTRVSSLVASYALSNLTPTAGRGPIMVLIAHSDYSLAEIEEYIESTGSWARGDMVAQEIQKRRIRRIGIFDVPTSAAATMRLNEGKPIKTKLNWQLEEGQSLSVVGYNTGAVLATTSPNIKVQGHVNLFSL